MHEIIPLAIIIVGGALLMPIVVGTMLTRIARVKATRLQPTGNDPAIARLEAELQSTRDELQRLSERQQFVEALLEKRSEPAALPPR
jgi:hypothetical protein